MKQILLMLVFMSQAMAQDHTDPLDVYRDFPIDPTCYLEIVSRKMTEEEYSCHAARYIFNWYMNEGKLDPASPKASYLRNNSSPDFSDRTVREEFYKIMGGEPHGDTATEESLVLVEKNGNRVLAEKRIFVSNPAACAIVDQFGPPRFVEVKVFDNLIGYFIENPMLRNYFFVPQGLVTDRSNVTCDFLLGLANTQLRAEYQGPFNFQ